MGRFGSAVILAGGRSTRMGFDKQLLKIDDKRISHHLIALLRTRFEDIMVATHTPCLYEGKNVRPIDDIHEGIGPLGGIHAALVYAKSEAVFTIACDMPFVALPYIDYMMSQMEGHPYDACATRREDRLETLHAFYCRSALPVLEDAVSRGRYSVHRFAEKINTLVIPREMAAPFLPNWLAFTNINTPEEYEMFLQQMRTPLFGVPQG